MNGTRTPGHVNGVNTRCDCLKRLALLEKALAHTEGLWREERNRRRALEAKLQLLSDRG